MTCDQGPILVLVDGMYLMHACKNAPGSNVDLVERTLLHRCLCFGDTLEEPVDPSCLVVALDCKRSAIWRRELFSGYKQARRDVNCGARNGPRDIKHICEEFIRNIRALAEKHGFRVVQCGNAEGEDVISAIVKRALETPRLRCQIIADDSDTVQLGCDRVVVTNLMGRDLAKRELGKIRRKLDLPYIGATNKRAGGHADGGLLRREAWKSPAELEARNRAARASLLYKFVYGDKSDNIEPLHEGQCRKAFLALRSVMASNRRQRAGPTLDELTCDDVELGKRRQLVDLHALNPSVRHEIEQAFLECAPVPA